MGFEGISNSFFFTSYLYSVGSLPFLVRKKNDSRKGAETQRFQLTRLLLAFMSKKSTHAKPAFRRQGFPTLRG
jgi:hypothetical protein